LKGALYIVSTPLGNLEDITIRALRVLKEVDLIAAEDTRHSRKLLTHYGISKPLISYWGEKERARAEEILRSLEAGKSVALISDAGTPGISDPGGVLIREAIEAGFRVIPIPGPTAAIAALSAAGFSMEGFVFAGFLPAGESQRRKALQELSLERKTLVFYEAPHRIVVTVAAMAEVFGERKAVIIREMTKLHEEVMRGNLRDLSDRLSETKPMGEYVVVVEGRKAEKVTTEDALEEVGMLIKKGLRRKDAVKRVAEEYGLSKKELYDRSLSGD